MLATALWRPEKKKRENTHHSTEEERWQSMTRIQRALRGSYDLTLERKKTISYCKMQFPCSSIIN
jgi:hypothetical protein